MGKGGGGGGRSKGREQGGGAVLEVAPSTASTGSELSAVSNIKEISPLLKEQWVNEIKKINEALDLRKKANEYSSVDNNKLEDYKFVLGELFGSKLKKLGIVDENKNIQAMMAYKKGADHIYVDYLVTAPWNLKKGDNRSVKGGGTAAIVEAIKISKREGFNGALRLESSETAKKFYEKLGFKREKNSKEFQEMYSLSASKANELLNKFK